jgi:GT2 family glycosyltransferase
MQCLDALAAQDFPANGMEVIVVADGCTDGTEAALADVSFPYPLHVLTQPGSGASVARNNGARAAVAPLLLFLDDDVVASAGLVAAHVRAHADAGRLVTVGPYPLDEPAARDFLAEHLHDYWERKIQEMASRRAEVEFRDIVSGNLSVSAEVFAEVGGFSPRFNRLEDYELGIRLLAAGVRYEFVQDAHARHLETTDLDRSLRMTRRTGSADTLMAALHPHVLPQLRLARCDRVGWFVLQMPKLSISLAAVGRRLLPVAERLRMRGAWELLYARIKLHAYWQGVADNVGSYREWQRRFARNASG